MNINEPRNSRELAKLMMEVKAGKGERHKQFMEDARELPDIETMKKKWLKKGDPNRFTSITDFIYE